MDNLNITTAPIYRSLLFPPMIAGMPRNAFISILAITATFCLGFKQYWFIIIGVLLVILFKYMAKLDIYFFDIYISIMELPEVLD